MVTLGSLSKTVWDGLRVGWIRADAGTIERLAAHPLAAQVATAPLEEVIAAELLGDLDGVLAERRAALCERRDHLLAALAALLDPGGRFAPAGGLDRGLRIPYSLPAPQLDTALERLAPLLAA